jgi:hypothetical protein
LSSTYCPLYFYEFCLVSHLSIVVQGIESDRTTGTDRLDNQPSISYNAFQRSIQLRGSGALMKFLKAHLEEYLKKNQHTTPSLTKRNSLNLLCSKKPHVGSKIFAMRHREDSELLRTWHEKIIPALPTLLATKLRRNYSASLVRKGTSKSSGRAVIQIQSLKSPYSPVQAHISKLILDLINDGTIFFDVQIHFLAGRPTLLAGEMLGSELLVSPEPRDLESQDADAEFGGYPYWRRYWQTPGPGASVGLRCTKAVFCHARVLRRG